MESSKRIKMKQMKTYTKSDFHNPEQLTRQQVGAEYRLLLPEEVPDCYKFADDLELIISDGIGWFIATGDSNTVTYRVPLATPLPDGTVLSSNECCFADELYSVDGGFCTNGIKKRIYVAGPMTGKPDFNFAAFHVAAMNLEEQGWEAVNPAQLDYDAGYSLERLNKLTPAEFQEFLKGAVKRDLDAIQTCQAIAMLPGWENSKGAKAELAVAQWLGLDEVYLDGAKQPYNSDERAEWNNECGKIDMGDYSFAAISNYAPDDPKGAAGAKKAPMDLLPPDALLETARAMGHGAAKYGRWNFVEAKVCAHTYVAAIGRHWAAYAKGQDDDAESGLKHLAHIAANCFILMTAAQQGTLNDDRPKLK